MCLPELFTCVRSGLNLFFFSRRSTGNPELLRGLSEFFFFLENCALESGREEELALAFCSYDQVARLRMAFLAGVGFVGAIGAAIDIPNKACELAKISALAEYRRSVKEKVSVPIPERLDFESLRDRQ